MSILNLSAQTGIPLATLQAYMDEDVVGGRDTGQWIGMSVHADEGKALYALVRHYKPLLCVEIGTSEGCGATHILAALEANGEGELISYDIDPSAGSKIPLNLAHRHTMVIADALHAELPRADFVFEDGEHSYEFNMTVLDKIMRECQPRVLVSHDLLSHKHYSGFGVLQAWEHFFGFQESDVVELAFTGLAVHIENGL